MREESSIVTPQTSALIRPSSAPAAERLLHSSTTESLYPYDAWVLAGGRLFRAHSNVLSAHSPYLRASINALGEPRLLLPHVPAAGFGAVLSYMYTGRLSMAQAPLYEILLTGHFLQMPGIVALCQTFLESSPQETRAASLPFVGSALPSALNAWQNLARFVPASLDRPPVATSSLPTLVRPTPTRPIRLQHHDIASTAEGGNPLPLIVHDRIPTDHLLLGEIYSTTSTLVPEENSPRSSIQQQQQPIRDEAMRGTVTDISSTSNSSSVVLDIAACDGPVFFERVVNKAFKSAHGMDDNSSDSDSSESEINVVDTTENDPPLFINKFLISSPAGDREDQPSGIIGGGGGGGEGSTRTYHCIYCNNNFKSHYCFQKHMRRHINPITVENAEATGINAADATPHSATKEEKVGGGGGGAAAAAAGVKRKKLCETSAASTEIANEDLNAGGSESGSESCYSSGSCGGPGGGAKQLRVLDLNVQYFPCKTCGSKFPSYYFVHKHRRMCHRDEEATDRDKSAPSTPNSSCDSLSVSRSSNIKSVAPTKPPPFPKEGEHEN